MSDEPKFVAKPVFVVWLAMMANLPLSIFISVFLGMMGIPLVMVMRRVVANQFSVASCFAVFALVLIFGVLTILSYLQSRLYQQVEYKFYGDRVEYDKGFLSIEHKSVPYDRITDVSLKRGILQQRRNLGNIRLETPITLGGSGGRGITSGITLNDVGEPEKLYEEIKKLVFSKRS